MNSCLLWSNQWILNKIDVKMSKHQKYKKIKKGKREIWKKERKKTKDGKKSAKECSRKKI